jgi:tRNA(Ile)-lysidine synthase
MKKNHPLGIEGHARELRYSALNNLRAGVLVTAHHQQDQIETFLLQLLRGSGLRGLSSMQEFDEKRILWRPFLNVDQALIKDYLINNKIEFAQDESNFNDKFDRNFLRNNILPLIIERFPQALKTINRSINLIAEGFHLNQIIAEKDFHHYLLEDHKLLALSAFAELDKGRLVNLIRWWLSLNDLQMPSQKLINEIIKQVKNKKDEA